MSAMPTRIRTPKGRVIKVTPDRLFPVITARIRENEPRRQAQLANLAIFEAQRLSPVDTGRLRGSIRILARSPNRVTIGSKVPYAKYMEARFGFLRAGILKARALLGYRRSIQSSNIVR